MEILKELLMIMMISTIGYLFTGSSDSIVLIFLGGLTGWGFVKAFSMRRLKDS
ncbi:hypothetical protein SAMN04490247_0672 [Salimicrobium halophilum]|uniref:Uncharacterized protein n=1 Tax=Salimicrobium halophilum TaxID=86666 RepID=A0A1G8QWD6_9BACI|nr:hypothetical protein SAMN04490247_0672 [Salimicrobium halophilum]